MKKKVWLIILAVILVIGVITAVFVIRNNQNKANTYQKAVQLAQTGNTAEAYCLFRELGTYLDSEQRLSELVAVDALLPYRVAEKEDIVSFGHFEQDNDPSNGPEPIQWIVLDKMDGQLLLISASCLQGMAYNTATFTPVTWETSSLRTWLNESFLSSAFTEEEKALIPTVLNENPDHSIVETPGGRDTQDQVFVLCERDTVIYLSSPADREAIGKAPATEYAKANGLQTDEEGNASWWLRPPGMYEYIAQFVDRNGEPYTNGASTDIDYLCGVRPVLWLNTNPSSEGGQL